MERRAEARETASYDVDVKTEDGYAESTVSSNISVNALCFVPAATVSDSMSICGSVYPANRERLKASLPKVSSPGRVMTISPPVAN